MSLIQILISFTYSNFGKDRFKVFRKSFARENLSFVVRKAENKEKKIFDILQKVKAAVKWMNLLLDARLKIKQINKAALDRLYTETQNVIESSLEDLIQWLLKNTRGLLDASLTSTGANNLATGLQTTPEESRLIGESLLDQEIAFLRRSESQNLRESQLRKLKLLQEGKNATALLGTLEKFVRPNGIVNQANVQKLIEVLNPAT